MAHLTKDGLERLWANADNTFAKHEEYEQLKERVTALEEALAALTQEEA